MLAINNLLTEIAEYNVVYGYLIDALFITVLSIPIFQAVHILVVAKITPNLGNNEYKSKC